MQKILPLLLLFLPVWLLALDVAVGPNSSDYLTDGVADEVQIQQAIDAVHAAGGGTVQLEDIRYNIDNQAIVAKSNVELRGLLSPNQTILFSERTFDYVVLNSTAIRNFQLNSLFIDTNNAQNASGMRLENATDCTIEGVSFINVDCGGWHLVVGVRDSDAMNRTVLNDNITIRNANFVNHRGSLEMLLVFNTQNMLIEDCLFTGKTSGCPSDGNAPVLGLWQNTERVTIRNCGFTENASREAIYYSNVSNNTLIENCSFSNTGGIRGANESDNGTFGVPFAKNLIIRDCILTGGANDITNIGIELGAVQRVLIDNCTITQYEEGIVFAAGNNLNSNSGNLDTQPQHWAVINTTIANNNPADNVHDLHPGVLFQERGGGMNGFFVCGKLEDTRANPGQEQPFAFTTQTAFAYSELYFLGTDINAYAGRPLFKFLDNATQGTPFVVEDCTGNTSPTECADCPQISDAAAVAWIDQYDPTTAAIITQLLAYNSASLAINAIPELQVTVENERSYLNWKYLQAAENQQFIIEKSSDGEQFSFHQQVENNINGQYQVALDRQWTNYYFRLQLVANERTEFSNIVHYQSIDGSADFQFYPNPVGDVLHFKTAFTNPQIITIFNALGQIVLRTEVVAGQTTLDNLDLLPGWYSLKLGARTVPFLKK